MPVRPAGTADAEALRDELRLLRVERDSLAARVIELEQQLAATAAGGSPADRGASFEDSFRVEQARAKRQRLALSLALVELDGLQDVRDRMGHGAGEAAFVHLGRLLEQSLRPTDVVGRIDGLSYGVLLTGTTLEQALAALARLQQDVSRVPFAAGQGALTLGFSAGLVQWRNDESLGDLLSRASRALGMARRGGAGRVVVG